MPVNWTGKARTKPPSKSAREQATTLGGFYASPIFLASLFKNSKIADRIFYTTVVAFKPKKGLLKYKHWWSASWFEHLNHLHHLTKASNKSAKAKKSYILRGSQLGCLASAGVRFSAYGRTAPLYMHS